MAPLYSMKWILSAFYALCALGSLMPTLTVLKDWGK